MFYNSASYNGRLDVVIYLCEQGADIELGTFVGATPMHTAAYSGHLDVVKYLYNKGAKIDAEQAMKWTPLHLGWFVFLRNFFFFF